MTIRDLYEYGNEHNMLDYEIAVSCHSLELCDDDEHLFEFQGLTQIVDDRFDEYFKEDVVKAVWLVCADGALYEETEFN